tara:strand:+ start:10479 stop:10616 length:138 start_codon:yes stop_codon:yes gene_type:complete
MDVFDLEFGVWNLEFGIWNLEFGIFKTFILKNILSLLFIYNPLIS